MKTLQPLNGESLERLRPLIELELHRRLRAMNCEVTLPPSELLQQIFVQLCGPNRSRVEQMRFLAFAASLTREAVISEPLSAASIAHLEQTAFRTWFYRVQSIDPIVARMIDLFYFGALGVRRTAALLGISRGAVIRELRFAKAWWLQARSRQMS